MFNKEKEKPVQLAVRMKLEKIKEIQDRAELLKNSYNSAVNDEGCKVKKNEVIERAIHIGLSYLEYRGIDILKDGPDRDYAPEIKELKFKDYHRNK